MPAAATAGFAMTWPEMQEWTGSVSGEANAQCKGARWGVPPVPREHTILRDSVYFIILPHHHLMVPASCHNLQKHSAAVDGANCLLQCLLYILHHQAVWSMPNSGRFRQLAFRLHTQPSQHSWVATAAQSLNSNLLPCGRLA